MAFKVEKVSETSSSVVLGETLWLTADRDRVVPEGDPEAAFLLGTAGKRVAVEEAERLGLIKAGKAKKAEDEPEEPAEPAENLDALNRDELNELAESLGVENPAGLPNKDAVIAAIEKARAD
jgi:hypothetical protein